MADSGICFIETSVPLCRVTVESQESVDSSPLLFHRPSRGVIWRDWSSAAFDAARIAGRPVLLLLTTPWSAPCAALERTLAEDGPAAELVAAEYVPVRVDAERRPD